jgi:Tol biopolymer transport system component
MASRHRRYVVISGALLTISFGGCGSDTPVSPVLRTDDGSRIAFVTRRDEDMEIFTMTPAGTDYVQVTTNFIRDDDPGWSPDGQSIVYSTEQDGNWEMYVRDADGGGTPRRLTDTYPHWEGDATYDRDGGRILFSSDRDHAGTLDIFVMDADGTNVHAIASHAAWDANPDWSPDGTQIVFQSQRNGDWDIYIANVNNTGAVLRLTLDQGLNADPVWSPDGQRIAFKSDRTGRNEIWTMNPDGSGQRQITTSGGEEPSWSPDGAGIAFSTYRDGNWEIYVMNADGTNQTNITNNPFTDEEPDWSR